MAPNYRKPWDWDYIMMVLRPCDRCAGVGQTLVFVDLAHGLKNGRCPDCRGTGFGFHEVSRGEFDEASPS